MEKKEEEEGRKRRSCFSVFSRIPGAAVMTTKDDLLPSNLVYVHRECFMQILRENHLFVRLLPLLFTPSQRKIQTSFAFTPSSLLQGESEKIFSQSQEFLQGPSRGGRRRRKRKRSYTEEGAAEQEKERGEISSSSFSSVGGDRQPAEEEEEEKEKTRVRFDPGVDTLRNRTPASQRKKGSWLSERYTAGDLSREEEEEGKRTKEEGEHRERKQGKRRSSQDKNRSSLSSRKESSAKVRDHERSESFVLRRVRKRFL